MKPSEIEYWAHKVMDLVEAGHAVEDGLVELKREWINAQKAARRIAAHANAARGEPILWLVGIDEKEGVIGVGHEEFSSWFNSVASCFDGLPPSCTDLNIPREGRAVTALLFDTMRAPFVVKNSRFGQELGDVIALEVPWREGRKTRSARREELLRLLVPATRAPAIEWLEASLTIRDTTPTNAAGAQLDGTERRFTWDLQARLYAEPASDLRLVIPFHRCEIQMQLPGQAEKRSINTLQISPPRKLDIANALVGSVADSHTITSTGSEVILEGPGMLSLEASAYTGLPGGFEATGAATIWIRFRVSGLENSVDSVLVLQPDPTARKASGKSEVVWRFEAGQS